MAGRQNRGGESTGTRNFMRDVERCFAKDQLMEPARDFISKLYLCPEMKDKSEDFLKTLSKMVSIANAEQSSKRSEHGKRWLKEAARTLNDLQLASFDWICANVFQLPKPKRKTSSEYNPEAGTKDIRYSEEDRAKGHVDILSLDILPVEEEQVFTQSKPTSMEVDPVPVIQEGSRKSGGLASEVHVVKSACKTTSGSGLSSEKRQESAAATSTITSSEAPEGGLLIRSSSSGSRKTFCSSEGPGYVAAERPQSYSRLAEHRPTETSVRHVQLDSQPEIKTTKRRMETVPNTTSKKRKQKQHFCWVPGCTSDNSYVKVHAYEHHVPGIFRETLPGDDLQVVRSRERALRTAGSYLFGRPASLEDLLDFVRSMELMDTSSSVNDKQREAMLAFCRDQKLPVPDNFYLQPVNSPAALIHWKIVYALAACMNSQQREEWKLHFPVSMSESKLCFDAHFHLDRTLRHNHLSFGSWDKIVDMNPELRGNMELVGMVAVVCDPDTYPTKRYLHDLPRHMFISAGFHPKHASCGQRKMEKAIESLKTLLLHPHVKALGEIGLDHSEDCHRWPAQMILLKKLLPLLRDNQVLVLHCRGMVDDCGTEVYCLLLSILRRQVRRCQPIHLHCFTGNQYVLKKWLEAFPESYFGFTSMISTFDQDQKEALCSIPSDRLLLETDAPYFAPSGSSGSKPEDLLAVTSSIARYRGSTVEQVLHMTANNGRQLYAGVDGAEAA